MSKYFKKYKKLNISYHYKENSGPGDSRNFGMKKARGSYFCNIRFRLFATKRLYKKIDQ